MLKRLAEGLGGIALFAGMIICACESDDWELRLKTAGIGLCLLLVGFILMKVTEDREHA